MRPPGQALGQLAGAGFPCPLARALVHAFDSVRQQLAVHGDLVVVVADAVAGQADHPLDPVLARVVRGPEHDHVAALRFAVVEELLVGDRPAQAVGELVDQDEVADQQGRHHRAGRDPERFRHEAAQAQYQRQDREEGLGVVDDHRFLRLFQHAGGGDATLGEEQLVEQPDQAGQGGQGDQDRLEPHHHAAFSLACAPITCCPPATRRGRPPAGSRPGRPASSASCLPSASPAASSCASRRHRSTWRARSCAAP